MTSVPTRSLRRRFAAALHTQRGLMFIQSVGIIVGLAMSAVSLILSIMVAASTLHGQRERTSADLMLKFDGELGAGKNSELLDAIEGSGKVITENGGKFSDEDMDQLLGARLTSANSLARGDSPRAHAAEQPISQ